MRRFFVATRDAVRHHPWSFDITLGALLAVSGLISTRLTIGPFNALDVEFNATGSYTTAVILGGAIAVRRRWPLAVLAVVSVVYVVAAVNHATEGTFSAISVFLAVYTAGTEGRRPAAHWARLGCLKLMAVLLAWSVITEVPDDGLRGGDLLSLQLLLVFLNVFYFSAAWLMGDQMHGRRLRERRLEVQSAELAAAHAEIARQAVGAERMRIARELHDVVAHHVSVMGVQAGAARRILARSPERATEALEAIESSSRDAVNELHSLLGFLRQEGDLDSTAPPPTLEAVPALVEQVEQAGVTIDLTSDGVDDQLSAGIDLSAFRVIQESLTNVVKHSGPGTRAEVAVRQTSTSLEVLVIDDGRGSIARARRHRRLAEVSSRADEELTSETGNGLVGMQERVALHGGTLDATCRKDGGFEVRATFNRQPTASGRS